MGGRIVKTLAAALAACGLAACATQILSELGVPVEWTDAEVQGTTAYAGYLDAWLVGGAGQLRFLFPDNENCRLVVGLPGRVSYTRVKYLGDVDRGATHCEPVGIASLEAWRDLKQRPVLSALPTAETASFHVIFSDPNAILVRGNLPKAGRIGWDGTRDMVAVLPPTPECFALAGEGTASMQFYGRGQPAFLLENARGRCPITGFARPL